MPKHISLMYVSHVGNGSSKYAYGCAQAYTQVPMYTHEKNTDLLLATLLQKGTSSYDMTLWIFLF